MTKAVGIRKAVVQGIVWAALAIECASALCMADGGNPPYLVLQKTPPFRALHGAAAGPTAGQVIPLETRPYAYGWFGAQPRRQWSRHFGYYRNYTEWSGK